ncbi:ABC transporter ATP-binding protein [Rubritalea marina]|uniref:ABC transporter ATP-binding protein n=1 Tax=Rubritalea marina TaxID=361055 RepID=UPI00036DDDC0|nr:ABC transporter ATP-binding protein [Rubritalea marina]
MKTIIRIFSYYNRYPKLASAQLLCAVLMTVMLLVFPEMTSRVYTEVLKEFETSSSTADSRVHLPEFKYESIMNVVTFALIALSAFFLRELFNCLRIIINNIFEQRAVYDLRSELYDKLQRLPVKWFDSRRTGDIMTRVAEDVPSMERLLIDGIEQGLIAVLQISIVGGYLIWKDTVLGLTALTPLPLLFIGAVLYTRNAKDRHREVKRYTGEMNSVLSDNIAGITQIKSYAAEEDELNRFNSLSAKVKAATLKVMKYWAFYSPSMSFVNNIGYVLVLLVGAIRIINNPEIGTEIYLYFYTILWALYEPIGKLHGLNQMALSSRAAADRVFEILDTEDEIHASAGVPIKQELHGHIRMQNVSFSYDELPTLNDISLEAKPGQTIALVGSTGAGKSTLVNLLTRFYEYDSGSISVDGQELNTLNKAELRANIAYVTQDSFLFNGSVKENLLLGKRDATDEELWAALEAANARAFTEALPNLLDTNVGERGVKLSGGEKQRLSIARALLKNRPILILDEATASVDSQTEKLIQAALDKLMSNRTAFVIAHRLSTIQNADIIHVLDKGKIIESGNHQSLLAQGGRYTELCRQALIEPSN